MSASRWDDDLLDQMRLVGDEPADRAVAALFDTLGTPQWGALHTLLDSLVGNDAAVPPGLPRELTDYLTATRLPASRVSRVAAGEAFFAEHGPEILMLLGCYSLPAAYAAAKGVRVLCRTDFLERAAQLRLFQTAQMIVDVLSPGGLAPGGTGIRAAQKVRLLHAAIRHMILSDTRHRWDIDRLGLPINQEDLAGTLLTFSSLILDGLAKLDIVVSADAETAYFEVWRVIGGLMGVRAALIPSDVAGGRKLMRLIQHRQIASSPEGVRLTAALLKALSEGPLPGSVVGTRAAWLGGRLADDVRAAVDRAASAIAAPLLARTGAVLMRHCLRDEYDARGTSVADILRVPAAPAYADHLLDVGLRAGAWIIRDLEAGPVRRRGLRLFNLRLIDWMVAKELGDGRPLFSVPPNLHAQWMSAPTR